MYKGAYFQFHGLVINCESWTIQKFLTIMVIFNLHLLGS
jgi:hypothetical protein